MYIEEQFKEEITKSPNIQILLNSAVEMAAAEEIKSVSVDIDGKIKAKISITSKGNIKTERTKTDKKSKEA